MDKNENKRDRKADMKLRKKTKKQFNTDLNIEEKEEIDKVLSEHEIDKATFVRKSFEKLKEELKMIKYLIVYEDEKMKNENESTYEYSECEMKEERFDTLKEAREKFKKFKSYTWTDCDVNKTLYKRIATLYKVHIDKDDEIDDNFDWEQIDTK